MNADAPSLIWNFFGRVVPERVVLRAELPMVTAEYPAFNLRLNFGKLIIYNSQIITSITIASGAADIFTLRNMLADHVRSFLDLVGHQAGLALELDLVGATTPDQSEWQIFGSDIPVLSSAKGVLDAGPRDIGAALVTAAVSDLWAKAALADFRKAMTDAVGTGFYCYRASESLMQAFRPDPDSGGAAWEPMRDTLSVARDLLDFIKSHADDRRHGRIGSISDQDRKIILVATDQIIQRYLTYILERVPISKPELTLASVRAST